MAKSKKHDEIQLTPEDGKHLGKIWKKIREDRAEKRKKDEEKKKPSKKSFLHGTVRLAFEVPYLRPLLLPLIKEAYAQSAPVEEGEEETKGKKKGPPPGWNEFLDAKYKGGRATVPNTNPKTKKTYKRVSVSTLLRTDKAFKSKVYKEYQRWMKENGDKFKKKNLGPAKEETPEPQGVASIKLPPDRYKDIDWDVDFGGQEGFEFNGKKITKESIADACGAGLAGGRKISIKEKWNGELHVQVWGKHIDGMERTFNLSKGTIHNDYLVLEADAPKGLGSKIFASEVQQAAAQGFKHIETFAAGNKDFTKFVGYKVWPKLGYRGEIPSNVSYKLDDHPEIEDELKKAGFKPPYDVQDFYQTSDTAIEWWEENGDGIDVKFALDKDSTSMKVLDAYIKAKNNFKD